MEIVCIGLEDTIAEAYVEYNYTPHQPGNLSGPPEDCYPAFEEEWEWLSLTIEGNDCLWMLDYASVEMSVIAQIKEE